MQDYLDYEYLALLNIVLQAGKQKKDRTGVGTRSIFGGSAEYSIGNAFPLLTTKKVSFKNIAVELLWFLRGDTNTKFLKEHGVTIWDEWADKDGNLGPIYGKQWRDFGGVDQIAQIEKQLKTDPNSRRIILSAWNPSDIQQMALPPCHMMAQFYVHGGEQFADGKPRLDCQLYQRSADMFLGVPYNIASYSLLTYMLAHSNDMRPGTLIHVIGDAHIYNNHVEQVDLQLSRNLYARSPQLRIKRKCDSILDYNLDDFEIVGYDPYPAIPAPVAV